MRPLMGVSQFSSDTIKKGVVVDGHIRNI
jgi:hypothetical protein